MAYVVTGLFADSKHAGEAAGELKGQGYGDISVVAKDDHSGKTDTHDVNQDTTDGAAAGTTAGAVIGGLATFFAGVAPVVLPGVGIVLGPLATVLAGAAAGAAAGSIVGGLVDQGIPENVAKDYEERVKAGEVLVAVANDKDEHHAEIMAILTKHGATDVNTGKK